MFDLSPIEVPDLSGKTILITGAGKGIGAVVAGLTAAHGAQTYAGVHRAPDPNWEEHLASTSVVQLDVTDANQVNEAIERIDSESGKLDALVNNAGIIVPIKHINKLSTDEFRDAYEVNALGLHRVTCASLPLLRKSKGVVVNAGTGAATTAMEGWSAYCNSKAAARMLTLMFANELGDEGIQYFFLGIPPTDTAMQAEIRKSGLNPISKIPQEQLVDPLVPASVLAWLCGKEARKIEDVLIDVRDDFFKAMMDN